MDAVLSRKDFSRIENMLTQCPVSASREHIVRRGGEEVMDTFFIFALPSRRIHKEVVRWIRFHFNEELGEAKLRARRAVGSFNGIQIVSRKTADVGFHLRQSARRGKPR